MRKIIGVAVVIFLLSLAYYFAIVLPSNTRQELQLQHLKMNYDENKASALIQCENQLAAARDNGAFNTATSVTQIKQGEDLIIANCMRSKGFEN